MTRRNEFEIMSLKTLWKYASDLAWHRTQCPFCGNRNDLDKAEMRREKAPGTFNLPSLDGKDVSWQCAHCLAWIKSEDEE